MKLLRTICVLALALSLATSVYAGTQSVKLSGDLSVRGIYRDKYNLGTYVELQAARLGTDRSNQEWMMSTTEAQIDADLTDNVSAVVRLANQRDWNVFQKNINPGATNISTALNPNGRGGYTENTNAFDVIVDLAYIELKEFLYSPLTLKIGRQDIWFGKGFIVGANQQNPGNDAASMPLSAPEFSVINSFDSIRGTLDYDPWTVDVVYASIYGNTIQSDDGISLLGTNIGYIFDSYNAEAETYYWYKKDRQIEPLLVSQNNDVHCLGVRGSGDPIENWTASAEAAYQFGHALLTPWQLESRDRSAWALDAGIECRELTDRYAWKPVVTAEYIYYSGDINAADLDDEVGPNAVATAATDPGLYTVGSRGLGTTVGMDTGWDPMLRGKYDTLYREFIGKYYFTSDYPVRDNLYQATADASFTNQHQLLFGTSLMPTDSLTCSSKLAVFWLDEYATNRRQRKFVGTELDMALEWDYTEDVTFGLLSAWFFPGNVYEDRENTASELTGSVKLTF